MDKLPVFRVLKQQDFQVGWKLSEDIKVAGRDGQVAEGLQTTKSFQEHTLNSILYTIKMPLKNK